MSTLVEPIPRSWEDDAHEGIALARPQEELAASSWHWGLASFADDQIRCLVQQIFLSGRKRIRQVVFSSVDEGTDISSLCLSVGKALVHLDSGNACVVEALSRLRSKGAGAEDDVVPGNYQKRFGVLRDAAQQLSSRLWFMSGSALLDGDESKFSPLSMRGCLAELRLEFDNVILQARAAGVHSESRLLGRLCDGVVLVVQANSTRRAAAQRAKQLLHAANACLLGTVLIERTFPIPEAIYKKL